MHNIQVSDNTPSLSTLVDRTVMGQEPILLTTKEDKQAILLSVEIFESLMGLQNYAQCPLMPLNEFQIKFRQDLVDAGYGTKESILNLLNDVKQEIVQERSHPLG
jgi:hypothetical protein